MLYMDFYNDLFFTHMHAYEKKNLSTSAKASAQRLLDKWKHFSAV